MTYISLPAAFKAADGQPSGYEIQLDGARVAWFQPDAGILVDAKKLADNFAAMFNGHGPVHHLGSKAEMYFQPMQGGGVILRFRAPGAQGGVTQPGAVISMYAGSETLLDDARAKTPEAFKAFMGAVGKDERRATPRLEGGKGGGKAPQGKPARKPVF